MLTNVECLKHLRCYPCVAERTKITLRPRHFVERRRKANRIFMISGLRCCVCQVFVILGYHIALIYNYRLFGTACCPHLQRSSCLRLKMGPIRCIETSASNYETTLRNIPKWRRSQPHVPCKHMTLRNQTKTRSLINPSIWEITFIQCVSFVVVLSTATFMGYPCGYRVSMRQMEHAVFGTVCVPHLLHFPPLRSTCRVPVASLSRQCHCVFTTSHQEMYLPPAQCRSHSQQLS